MRRVDHQLGLVVDALRGAGMWDDTALLFFSDHGDYTGDYDLVEKTQNTFEDALVRVPFLLKPPRSRAPCEGRISPALVELVDVAATLYDLAGIDPGYTHFGRSLLPLAMGEVTAHRDAVFCEGGRRRGETHAMERGANERPDGLYWPRVGLQVRDDAPYHSKAVMCRTADHKYVHRLYERDELYDLRDDPAELRNLIDDPGRAPLAGRAAAAPADLVPGHRRRRAARPGRGRMVRPVRTDHHGGVNALPDHGDPSLRQATPLPRRQLPSTFSLSQIRLS